MNQMQMQKQMSVQTVQQCQMFVEQTKDTIETIKYYGECLKEHYDGLNNHEEESKEDEKKKKKIIIS
jgi:hypothetical protein